MVKCHYTSFWIPKEKKATRMTGSAGGGPSTRLSLGSPVAQGVTTNVSIKHKWLHGMILQGSPQIAKITIVRFTHAKDLLYQSQKSTSLTIRALLLSRKPTLSHKLYKHSSLLHEQWRYFSSLCSLTNVSFHNTVQNLSFIFLKESLSVYTCDQIFQSLTCLLIQLTNLLSGYYE